jgi:hypothetical protein
MTEKEVARLFEELSGAAHALNEESDAVTGLIRQYEDQLNGLRLGVEVWVTISSLEQDFRWYDPHDDDRRPWPAKRSTDRELGFRSMGREWRLVFRQMKYQRIASGDWEETEVGQPVALLETPRVDRIDALEHVPELLSKLKDEAQELLGKVKAAKVVVK